MSQLGEARRVVEPFLVASNAQWSSSAPASNEAPTFNFSKTIGDYFASVSITGQILDDRRLGVVFELKVLDLISQDYIFSIEGALAEKLFDVVDSNNHNVFELWRTDILEHAELPAREDLE